MNNFSHYYSEDYIQKNIHIFNLRDACIFYKLSEEFIENNLALLQDYWKEICIYQKLSESFIERHKDEINWQIVCKYQKLSEEFIERNPDCINLIVGDGYTSYGYPIIGKYQRLSEGFLEKYNINTLSYIWLYKDNEYKRLYIRECTKYKLDGDKLIAYKSCRRDGYSAYNFQYQYKVGEEYESTADTNPYIENSFGLSAWSKRGAFAYCEQKLFKVEIDLADLACITVEGKIRARKIKILEEIKI